MRELTRIRSEHGWSQQRLSEEAEVNKATINQIERGRRSPNLETIEKLATALGVEVADFFPRAEVPLPFEEGVVQRRSPFLEAWTSYMLRRAQEWEDALPERARALRSAIGRYVPFQTLLGLIEELAAKPELASQILLRNEMIQSELDAMSVALTETVQIAQRTDAPEIAQVAGTKRFARADFREYIHAYIRMSEVAEKWTGAEYAARAAGDKVEGSEERLWAIVEAIERAARARRKVVAQFEGRRSA